MYDGYTILKVKQKPDNMGFRIFRQNGKEILIYIDNVLLVRVDETTGKTIFYSNTQSYEVDESFEEVKLILGIGPKKEIRGF